MFLTKRVTVRAFSVAVETPLHMPFREALLDRAMGSGRTRKSSELLRRSAWPADGLSFVALDERGILVGTVRLWNVLLGDEAAPALLLGPLAVDPGVWNVGIGLMLMLMRHAVGEAKRLKHGSIVLVGDAAYYARFGFSAEKTGHLRMPGAYQASRLLGLELNEGTLDDVHGLIRAAGPLTFALQPRDGET